jgi:High potential iron-sulfur protein
VPGRQDNEATRRGLMKATLTLVGATAAPASAQEKIAQTVVQYQNQPKNGQMCSTCANFEPPNACKIVAGTINPNGWCLVYAPKT